VKRINLLAAAMVLGPTFWGDGAGAAQSRAAAAEQPYPARPVRMIVASAPGGGADIMGRIFAQKFNEAWGQPVVVDNRGGVGGRPRAVNRAPACGMRTSASRDARRWI
jgi:tripartite-type tricarboxylate transporter receptor subunit TctC